MAESNPFKDSQSRWRTLSLFWENRHPDYDAMFTLKEEAHQGLPSLYQLYLDSCSKDPTEYTFAKEHLGGWTHWKTLKKAGWFKPHHKAWREELQVRLQSESISRMEAIRNASDPQSATRIQATKWLAEHSEGRKSPATSRRGRPSKDEVEGNLKQETREAKELSEDAKNIGLLN